MIIDMTVSSMEQKLTKNQTDCSKSNNWLKFSGVATYDGAFAPVMIKSCYVRNPNDVVNTSVFFNNLINFGSMSGITVSTSPIEWSLGTS